jgi:hypothetical protein
MRVGGIARFRLALGYDKGNAVADATHHLVGKDRPMGAPTLGAAHVLGHEQRRQAADPVGNGVCATEDQDDAGRRCRCARVPA